jgi:hypothetical protein
MYATVDLSDLNIIDGLNTDLLMTVDSAIESGDLVAYISDEGKEEIGFYVTLWAYEHDGETSPYFGDNRVMAYVLKLYGGSDYADIRTIVKLVDNTPTMIV